MPERFTQETLKIIDVLLKNYPDPSFGFDIARATFLATGTVYGSLLNLLSDGWVEKSIEPGDAKTLGRRPRTYYKLTPTGRQNAEDILRARGVQGFLKPGLA